MPKKGEKQNTLANLDENFIEDEDDYETVKLNLMNLINFYKGDVDKLSEDLDISKMKLDNIAKYYFEDHRVETSIAYKINNYAGNKIVYLDKLTKAYNRYYLKNKTAELFNNNDIFNLYYLDLNKFKPVNDNYGHEAGDVVLEQTVARLQSLEELENNIFRVGGDEFVLLQTKDIDKNLEISILKEVEKTITYNDIEINISTSVGFVNSSNYNNIEDMQKDADALMFKDKKSEDTSR